MPERSLSYLCRNYDTLNHRDSYLNAKTAYQIGLLNFTLFETHPEFYASYKMMNEKSHQIYSDKLQLRVLDLTQNDVRIFYQKQLDEKDAEIEALKKQIENFKEQTISIYLTL
ncbi:PD-(D/E)XK nuclease family transposase [Butyrivibrio sp. INlla16]|uniref:PD-(D/E)XK nuclease family transposase n=1 Tax=Butyrivibrio sp. INlla16 TaxID=1520807 RepID=UPI00147E6703|nr:PD-(D/E)XK nuclease family transposase [Butyrivibrio sp. INlla16]